jgi:hypothetical protein
MYGVTEKVERAWETRRGSMGKAAKELADIGEFNGPVEI